MLRQGTWQVNHKRVERIWRMEGLKVPKKQPKRRRLWLNDGSCIRLRPEHKDHVWSYDFVMAWTANGKAFRILVIIDEYTRECLAMRVARHITSWDVIEVLYELFLLRGVPEHIRSDNGPEFSKWCTHGWLRMKIKHRHGRVRKSNDQAHVERFNRTIQDEFLRYMSKDVDAINRQLPKYLKYYNQERLHLGIDLKTPCQILAK